ncbi:hypothetical protein BOTBODRAFT_609535 [Botryobasidium botryosum FD-172 SS1]|uniref:assimilatory sulfite reductase (NADPH) n=1 Tax=Botryobasidium botryosum (strain FD-172 SS1) TaxID=930990 RepID=A0A067M6K3_BOTB1|nr:hypothetical protein BOTBODRAFT_609535 [Botryobasidium botryosum FD-172 SS1]
MQFDSGLSTPVSESSTLTANSTSNTDIPKSIIPIDDFLFKDVPQVRTTQVSASSIIEAISSRQSGAVYIYDLALQSGFGTLTKALSTDSTSGGTRNVVEIQSRAGAGLSIAGRMSAGTSREGQNGGLILTAYTTPAGFAYMLPTLSRHLLAPPSAAHRVVVQVPSVTPLEDTTLALTPSLAPINSALAVTTLSEHYSVVFSATAQESADISALIYTPLASHIVHVFDHHSASRETRSLTFPAFQPDSSVGVGLKPLLGQAGYSFFEYTGPLEATDVIVALNSPLALAVRAFAASHASLGVLSVRVLRPWDEDALKQALPSSARRIHVLDEVLEGSSNGALYSDVLSSLISTSATIRPNHVTPGRLHELLTNPESLRTLLRNFASEPSTSKSVVPETLKSLLLVSTPSDTLSPLPSNISQTFLRWSSIHARYLSTTSSTAIPGKHVTSSRILLSATPTEIPVDIALPLSNSAPAAADFIGILDSSVLKTHAEWAVGRAKAGAAVLVCAPWTPAELAANLAEVDVGVAKGLRWYPIDPKAGANDLGAKDRDDSPALENVLAHIAFLRLYLGKTVSNKKALAGVVHSIYGEVVGSVAVESAVEWVWDRLIEVVLPPPAQPSDGAEKAKGVEHGFTFDTIDAEEIDQQGVDLDAPSSSLWHDAAKHIIFREAFSPPPNPIISSNPAPPSLRPDLAEETFLVTCSVNRRLTPTTYARNVFHLEFDTSNTGLRYAIGEALGVHGWNDAGEVTEFCHWYGVDLNALVTLSLPGRTGVRHTRTVFQALQQQIDIFGRPPKSFYAELAKYASSKEDQMALLFIAAPEGASTFKKLGEKDTVTFADVLRLYPSARPSIEVLCGIVGDIKPRHYSIASAQSVVGDRVDLLVVTVDWITPSGSPRFGQCTRYLADLEVGQKVTVSIKPSVMKLPPSDLQPIIMAGLGTGAAPFRAFIQHRALLVSQGKPVGPLVYYFGARHRSEEYLYGEEIEAYIQDSIITHAGLAFSRDTNKKVYIQHKMLEDGQMLAGMLSEKGNGVFYLCGPTWPVPDVYEALVGALVQFEGKEKSAAESYIEGLKEEERYVLEVY